MAFGNMVNELHGAVPKIPFPFCKTLINRAWRDLRRQNLWSFLMFTGRWVTPPAITGGTAAVTQGSDQVILDTDATALVVAAANQPTLITQRQFRVGLSGVYNIWGWDGASTLTLDAPFADPTAAAAAYNIFQCYYAAPYKDFLGWGSVRNMVIPLELFTDRYTRSELDEIDPQRMIYSPPSDVVPFMPDFNPDSSTFMYPMFELWGVPQSTYTYPLYGMRRGEDLVNSTDELPPPISEDCVLALARVYAYEWAEANKGDSPRNQGPDFRFLIGMASADYKRLYMELRRQDRDYMDNFFHRMRPQFGRWYGYYNTLVGRAFPASPIQ
jgi:hypothetical protein